MSAEKKNEKLLILIRREKKTSLELSDHLESEFIH